jgi:hypothetical protein
MVFMVYILLADESPRSLALITIFLHYYPVPPPQLWQANGAVRLRPRDREVRRDLKHLEQLAQRCKADHLKSGRWLLSMNTQEAQTLQLHEMVVWTPDGTKGEIIAEDGSGVNIRWEDGQFGYYRFPDLLSQIERFS